MAEGRARGEGDSLPDDEGLGDLFGTAEEVPPTYPIEQLIVDRLQLIREGTTWPGFTPKVPFFEEEPLTGGPIGSRLARLSALAPPPLTVNFRSKRHSLWGHKLWNAAKYLTKRMDQRLMDVRGKTVLELGAGLGVPSLIAYRNGARVVVVTDYPDDDLLDIIRLNVGENCRPELIDADVRGGPPSGVSHSDLSACHPSAPLRPAPSDGDTPLQQAACPRCVTEPLLWGKKEHIQHVLSYTGNVGFEVVLLSDILFNHVCNEDLADTVAQVLQRSPNAVAYCVFSHHRAHKQLQDLSFFDLCSRRGLQYEQVDEEAYELMFPDDRGPVEIRQPVKCYKIMHRLDGAGWALDIPARFDVVLQGTGLAQSYLAAALARSGLRVLHCDGQEHYGGVHTTFTWPQMQAYLARLGNTARSLGLPSPVIVRDRTSELAPSVLHRYLLDVMPLSLLSKGDSIEQLVQSDMARTLEFQNVSHFVLVLPDSPGGTSGERVMEVPLTRAAIYATNAVGLLEKRRVMKFVKDVEATLAEQHHAKTANPADRASFDAVAAALVAETSTPFRDEAIQHPGETLSRFVKRHYGMSGRALDIVTLMRQIDSPESETRSAETARTATTEFRPVEGLLHSIRLVRQLLTSVGAYGGSTPFLIPAYGAGEMAQNMCRISAVWGGLYVLRRSLSRIAVDEEKDQQYAVLSNGQQVGARIIVVPQEIASQLPVREQGGVLHVLEQGESKSVGSPGAQQEGDNTADIRYARVVIASRQPLFTRAVLREAAAEGPRSDTAEDEGATDTAPPIVMGLMRVPGTDEEVAAVVHIVQHSSLNDQAPDRSEGVVVHFTCDARLLSQAELQAFVIDHFCTNVVEGTAAVAPPPLRFNFQDDIILFVAFSVSAQHAARDGLVANPVDPPSETRKTHPYALEEVRKLVWAVENDKRLLRGEEAGRPETLQGDTSSKPLSIVTVPTLMQNLFDDGQYVAAAKTAYESVMAQVLCPDASGSEAKQKPIFLERLPPLPSPPTITISPS